ncbi:MAG: 30S ribosomal protein S6 [Dehalococcoidia bacterium]|nr:MAG: 30S ribosomal protein S6 [Dehalococcoidia bacterium]
MVTKGVKKVRSKKVTARKKPAMPARQLREYEMVIIFNPELTEDKFATRLDDISKYITEAGGAVSNIIKWGKRKLAYPIKQFSEGNYILTQFQLQPEMGKEIEAKLRISEDVLRHMLVRLES